VPPELVFDSTLGELFVVRLAGHALGKVALASVLFAVEQLTVPLVVVLGHQGCVAVEKALSTPPPGAQSSPLTPFMNLIRPSLEPLLARDETPRYEQGPTAEERLDRAVRLNVQASLAVLRTQDPIAALLSQGALELHGGVYRLDSGRVEWSD
jgi:carbonic anhydrase